MSNLVSDDQFGRPRVTRVIAPSAAVLFVTITGSVCPAYARSVCPPFDTSRVTSAGLRRPQASTVGTMTSADSSGPADDVANAGSASRHTASAERDRGLPR